MKSTFDKGMLLCDLSVVSIWIFMASWYGVAYSQFTLGFILPIAVARVMLSFGLYYRVQRIRWVVVLYVAMLATLSIYDFSIILDVFGVPFLKFLRCLCSFITCQEGYEQPMFISHFLQNYSKGLCPTVLYVLAGALLVLFCGLPIFEGIWYYFQERKKEIEHPHWPWKKIILGFALYILCAVVIIAVSYSYMAQYSIYPSLVQGLILVCFIFYLYQKGVVLTKIEKVYTLIMVVSVIAITFGMYLNAWLSLTAMLLGSVLLLWYFSARYKRIASSKILSVIVILVFAANVLLWSMRFMTGTMKVLALIAIVALAIAVIILYRKEKLSLGWSIPLVILTIGILPVLSLGYNPVACFDSEIVENKSLKECKYYGLLALKSQDGYGLRDRYGYVLKPEYKTIEALGEYTPLFMVENDKGEYGIYDILDGKYVVECKYTSIQPKLNENGERQRVWEIRTLKDGEEIQQYLKYDKGHYIITDDPVQYSW